MEWVRVSPLAIVVADEQRFWIHHPGWFPSADPFLTPMECEGSLASTRNILEGALCAAQQAAALERTPDTATEVPLTLARWVWRLAGYYHTTHSTPALMQEAAEKFAAAGRTALAQYAISKCVDEGGHDDLALEDIRSLGYVAEQVVQACVPATASALVSYFTQLVRADDPIGCIGYAYALERMASAIQQDHIDQVVAILPRGVDATKCLRVHSGVGYDTDHVEDAIAVAAQATAREREAIARTCYQTALLRHAAPKGDYLSEAALQSLLPASSLWLAPA